MLPSTEIMGGSNSFIAAQLLDIAAVCNLCKQLLHGCYFIAQYGMLFGSLLNEMLLALRFLLYPTACLLQAEAAVLRGGKLGKAPFAVYF